MKRLGFVAALLAAGWMATGSAQAKGWRKASEKLGGILQQELALTQSSADIHRALGILDRERSSLGYTAEVLDHAGSESMRRLASYRKLSTERDLIARKRGRSLYKLARGGLARLALEGVSQADSTTAGERVVRGRTLRFVVSHDLEELAVHRRAERRASAELVAASREQQSLDAMAMIQTMQDHVLVSAEQTLDPELRETLRARRRIAGRIDGKARKANRGLLSQVKSQWRELRSLRGLDGAASLIRPVRGRIVGGFGEYEDKVMRLPMARNGVELAARRNEPIRAMADGVVVLVTQLPGFEDVIVIDHGGGQYTLTARITEIVVVEGDEVQAGHAIARVAPKTLDDGLGRTVYIELRHGEKPVDPAPYLRRARGGNAG